MYVTEYCRIQCILWYSVLYGTVYCMVQSSLWYSVLYGTRIEWYSVLCGTLHWLLSIKIYILHISSSSLGFIVFPSRKPTNFVINFYIQLFNLNCFVIISAVHVTGL